MGENTVQDQFSVYQMKADRQYRPYRFHAYSYILQHGLAITADHYDLVYSSPLFLGDDPDIIRKRLNEKRPKSFSGHSVSMGDVIAINQAGVTQYYYLEQAGFIHLLGFIQPSSQSSGSDSQKSPSAAGAGGGKARILTLQTTDYLLKGRKGLWLAEDMLLVDGRSVLKRLHEKQMEVARREKKLPQQELSQIMQEYERGIKRKSHLPKTITRQSLDICGRRKDRDRGL